MKPIIKVHRDWQDHNQTLGSCKVLGKNNLPLFVSLNLERGWENNQKFISCIPAGTYQVKLEWSEKFKKELWEIKNVPGRSECKFHAANFWRQLNGCDALGLRLADIDGDGYYDITNSKKTMDAFHKALKPYREAILIITTAPNVF